MMLKSLKFVALAAALLIGTTADAAAIIGSQGFSITGTTTTSPILMSVATATSFLMTGVETTGSQTVDFIGFPNSPINNTTLNVASLGSFSFGSNDFGYFLASLGTEIITGNLNTREFRFLGSFAPGTLLSGFGTNSDAGVLLNFNQAGGLGNAIAVSWTLEMPTNIGVTPVPEPSSLTIAGLGMIGMTWFRRRRSAKT